MSIIHVFLGWVVEVFGPRSSGQHRARPAASAPEAAYPLPVQGPVRAPRRPAPRLLPRLYVLEAERARQYRRRVALILAMDFGIDLDRHVIGAEGLGR